MRRLLIYTSSICAIAYMLFVSSRPGSTIFTWLTGSFFGALALFGVSGVVLLERLRNRALTVCTGAAVALVPIAFVLRMPEVFLVSVFLLLPTLGAATTFVSFARQVPERRAVVAAGGLFALAHLAAPFAQIVGAQLFHSDFVSFAASARSGELPVTESFHIGPYTYDGVCSWGDDVAIWYSGDGFMSVRVLSVAEDGRMKKYDVGEGNGYLFDCDSARLRQD